MKVFIGNLPGHATLVELKQFLGEIDLRASFNCRRGKDEQQRDYYYFVAHTQSEEEGLALIRHLDGRCFFHKRVVARPFQDRGDADEPLPIPEDRRCNPDGVGEQIPLDL
jgi:hypothetical protein